MVLSVEPEPGGPSGEKATLLTEEVCPSRVLMSCPSLVRQMQMVLSAEPEARVEPSGEKAMLSTELVCPLRV